MRCDWSLNNVAKEPQLGGKVSPIVLPRRMHNSKYSAYHVFAKQLFSHEQIYSCLELLPENFSGMFLGLMATIITKFTHCLFGKIFFYPSSRTDTFLLTNN